MNEMTVSIHGQNIQVKRELVNLNCILFDRENPRIQYALDTHEKDDISQEELMFALNVMNDQFEKLLKNIEKNGGITDPIWLRKNIGNNSYTVIEGNTRCLVYKELREKYPKSDSWDNIISYILPDDISQNSVSLIRLQKHLFGATPWGAYEKARELFRLYEYEGWSTQDLSINTRLSEKEIINSIEAFNDMENQYLPKTTSPKEREKFSYFVEFRKNKKLKQLMESRNISVIEFSGWVLNNKFSRGEEIRQLPEILQDDDAFCAFLKGNFTDGLEQLELHNAAVKSKLFQNIEYVINGLNKMEHSEFSEIKHGFQPSKMRLIEKLYKISKKMYDELSK